MDFLSHLLKPWQWLLVLFVLWVVFTIWRIPLYRMPQGLRYPFPQNIRFRVYGLIRITALWGFICSAIFSQYWISIPCGIFMIIDDLIEIGLRHLHPLSPLIIAIVFILFVDPWYIGLFASTAIFKIFDGAYDLAAIRYADHPDDVSEYVRESC